MKREMRKKKEERRKNEHEKDGYVRMSHTHTHCLFSKMNSKLGLSKCNKIVDMQFTTCYGPPPYTP